MTAQVITAARVVTGAGDDLAEGWVRVEEGRVVATGRGTAPADDADRVDLGDVTVVPGFVDLHCHGGDGGDYPTTDPEEARRVANFHASQGTTTCMASLVTAPLDLIVEQIAAVRPLVDDGTVAGIHLEGPWISAKCKGAHPEDLLRPPHAGDVARLIEACDGRLRMVTIAPELEGGLDAVRAVVAAGAIAAVGHTAAAAEVVAAALTAGATVATHLYNGMPLMSHRDPGPVGALLTSHGTVLELICDGIHIDPVALRLAIDHVGPDRIALITDAMAAAGMGDGRYALGRNDVVVEDGAARLASNGSLAGSTLTMAKALRFVVERVGRPLTDAVTMASVTPARVLGRDDIGRLVAGRSADLVTLDADLVPTAVMRRGSWVRPPAKTSP